MISSHTLRFKINKSIVTTFLVIAFIFSIILAGYETKRRDNAVNLMRQSMSDALEQNRENLANHIFSEHARALKVLFAKILRRDQLVAVTAYDLTGGVLVSSEDKKPADLDLGAEGQLKNAVPVIERLGGEKMLSYTVPVVAYGETIGYCNIKHSLAKLNSETENIVIIFAGLLMALLALMLVMLNSLMAKAVLSPLDHLRKVMLRVHAEKDSVSHNRLSEAYGTMSSTFDGMSDDLKESITSKDEIGSLARSFDAMLSELNGAYGDILQAEENYRGIFENAIEGIFQIAPDGSILDANISLALTLGFNDVDNLLSNVTDLGCQCFKNRDDYIWLLQNAKEVGRVADVEMELVRKGGDLFWASLSVRPVTDEQDDILRFEGSVVDITERMEKERTEKERQTAEAVARARSEFLDNSGQGFLSFGMDLTVSDEYSRECETIFGSDIGGKSIAKLLAHGNARFEQNFVKNLGRIFDEPVAFKRDLYLSLMPREIYLDPVILEAEYTLIGKGKMMLILTDITRQKSLENEIKKERNKLKFVVSAVRESREFFEILREYELFKTCRLPDLLAGDGDPPGVIEELYRQVHTFKGLFGQQDFIFIPEALHGVESGLAQLKEMGTPEICHVSTLMEQALCDAALEQDLKVIEDILGGDFMRRQGEIIITQKQAESLKALADSLLSKSGGDIDEDTRRLLQDVGNIQRTGLRDLLSSYPKAALRLAESLEKEVKPFTIEGDDVAVDPAILGSFTKTLVHVFRNAIDHGIEDPAERAEEGKGKEATLLCRIGKQKSAITITISDDGRGLDADGLRKKAVEDGIMDEKRAASASDEQMYHLIFSDSFSTREQVSELSGRGVGLSAVQAELKRLGGEVSIQTRAGRGTTFIFTIPEINV